MSIRIDAHAILGCPDRPCPSLQTRVFPDKTYKEGNWRFDRLGDTHYYNASYIGTTDKSIDLVGIATNVTVQFRIPFKHRFIKASFYHTDFNYVASTANLIMSMTRGILTNYPQATMETIFNIDQAINLYSLVKLMDESEIYDSSAYSLTLASDVNDKIFASFIIEWLGAG